MLTKLTFKDFKLDDPKLDNSVRRKKKIKRTTDGAEFIELIQSWEKIVGPAYAKLTIPLKISYKILYILTPHSTYSEQLSFSTHLILQQINKITPAFSGKIKQIKFQVNPQFFQQKQQERSKKILKKEQKQNFPHRYSPQYLALKQQAENIYKDIEDQDIKKHLISLYIQSVFNKE